jgi:Protein of unknown function (DUF2752)
MHPAGHSANKTMSTWDQIVAFIEQHLWTCPTKKYLNIDCPGCGFQRSFVHLLRGEWEASFALYPALVPILMMFLLLGLHLKYDFKHGALALRVLFAVNMVIVLVSYVIKMAYLR